MNSSPRSTVSSDLYSPTDPAPSEAAHIANGIKHESSHKRKREDFSKSSSAVQSGGRSPSMYLMIDRHASTEQAPSSMEAEPFAETTHRFKRPRVNGYGVENGTDLSCMSSALPAVLWQQILCHVHPVFLGRMLSVNRAFNTILTSGQNEQDSTPLSAKMIRPLSAEVIWAMSRTRHCPGLPRPIHGLKELQMWKLLKGNDCQICGKVRTDTAVTTPQDPWESGPGDTRVRIVWPFGLRCCGPCLQEKTQKVPNCRHQSLATNRQRNLTVDRSWTFPCRRIARSSSCRVSLLPLYRRLITTLATTSYEA